MGFLKSATSNFQIRQLVFVINISEERNMCLPSAIHDITPKRQASFQAAYGILLPS
jgi:hypothetical protein